MNVRAIDGGVGNVDGISNERGVGVDPALVTDSGLATDDVRHYGGSASDPKDLKPGDRVAGGTYEIEAVLGKGGMTTVYLAKATANAGTAVKVALKVARGKNAARADVAARMRNEASIGAQLEPHPNLVRTVAGGLLEDGSPFVATEFVRAPALADVLIMDKTVPTVRAVRMAIDVGRALLAMHAKGFVHRDVKPGNILMLPESAMLLDLGLATKARGPGDTAPRMTSVFERPGTKHYMAPEQAAGAPADVRADVWSLGATLAEAVVGEPPMGSRSEAECVAWKLDGSAPQYAMPRTRADVPDELAKLVEAALVREPRLRSSLGDFVEGLTRVLGVLEGPGAVAPTLGSGSTAEGGRSRASMLMEIHRRAVTREVATGAVDGAGDRTTSTRWIKAFGLVAVVAVLGFGAWVWSRGVGRGETAGSALEDRSGRSVDAPTQGRDEVVPAAAGVDVAVVGAEAGPRIEGGEAGGGEVEAPVVDPQGPDAQRPAPTPATKPKPTPETPTLERPTPEKPTPEKPTSPKPTPTPIPAAAPEHESAECKATRDAAASAQRTRKHAEALRLLERRACWADRREHTRMLVDSLSETQKFAACVKAARGSKDPAVVEMGQMCAELLGEEKP